VLEWGVPRIAAALEPITARIEHEARARGLDPVPAGLRASHMLGIRLPYTAGIGERLAAAAVHVEILGSVMRVSPHLHVTEADVERLFTALGKSIAT
jgi:selenocysteine lyase/cysteine desulfurase